MRILIHGLNYSPEKVGIAVYTSGMAEALARMGHEVRVVAGKPFYPAWKPMEDDKRPNFQDSEGSRVQVFRVPHYIPRQPTGIKRMLQHVSFALSSLVPTFWNGLVWRPDVVVAITPAMLASPVARVAAFLGGSRSWLHLQDIEVEAAFATGLMAREGLPARLALGFEAALLGSFDMVSTISPQMCERLIEKGVPRDRITEFRNWADIDSIVPLVEPSAYRKTWDIATKHVALYSGSIANKQGIEIVIEAARRLQDRSDLTFVICGEGPNRPRLEDLAAGLGNLRFYDLQRKEALGELLGLASVHLLPQLAEAADLVLPSKLSNMLASGRPVVATAALGTGLAAEVEGCGLATVPGDVEGFAAAISRVLDDPALYAELGSEARRRAVSRWSKQSIIERFEQQLGVERKRVEWQLIEP